VLSSALWQCPVVMNVCCGNQLFSMENTSLSQSIIDRRRGIRFSLPAELQMIRQHDLLRVFAG